MWYLVLAGAMAILAGVFLSVTVALWFLFGVMVLFAVRFVLRVYRMGGAGSVRFAVIIGLSGFVVSAAILSWMPVFFWYLVAVLVSSVVFVLIGLELDQHEWSSIGPWIALVVAVVALIGFTFIGTLDALCERSYGVRENVLTGECRGMMIGCNPMPWYWQRTDRCDARFEEILEQAAYEHCRENSNPEFCVEMYLASLDQRRERSILNDPSE